MLVVINSDTNNCDLFIESFYRVVSVIAMFRHFGPELAERPKL